MNWKLVKEVLEGPAKYFQELRIQYTDVGKESTIKKEHEMCEEYIKILQTTCNTEGILKINNYIMHTWNMKLIWLIWNIEYSYFRQSGHYTAGPTKETRIIGTSPKPSSEVEWIQSIRWETESIVSTPRPIS